MIFEKAKTFKLTDQKITAYLKVLGHKGNHEHRQLLEDFLLSKQLNDNHSFVQWSTYPNFPDLFVKAYSKYLIETDYKEWTGSGIVQSFMSNLKALDLLKKYLEIKNNNVWKKFRNDLKTELTKDFWDKANKEEIARIISAPNNSLPKEGLKW